ncbi:MAG: hypothetical protein EOQ86_20210 [Mesorhizobium sp.]|uniref:antitoxin Xre/MbcA/ParS-like domain-containing protein n=1 Tax=Mesorhizobium sp. TaxID=1871066 RepID=UPI000FE91AA2|nr:hypothetical protein [Mesorhizobium sp.]RWH76939.1 MAG: hypothetical protein EOQ85_20680 [Mesorhizobium sp.]RWH80249.1 MAG: hypothetical protein EOQ86_20210 [Mesorhizobium sp.]RWH88673.1 MAG: hypothetical protein EOQ87_19870 [Mesorhizobium sp.]RWH95529.1 MAG: hypothetical protein EOQ88_22000 [Mesorhizobium sp.]RWI01214.1 MAG: hypothetical protein EOQ89_16210 [Mesorhizobium sp.]
MKQTEQRAVLTQAIEAKVHRLDMDALVKLAADLKVPMPEIAASPQRHRTAASTHTGGPTGNAVLVGKGIGRVLPAREGARRLDKITVDDDAIDWAESELVGAGEVVSRLKVARATLDNWRKGNKVIALRKGLRNYVYPLRQFDRRAPVDGLDKVTSLFSSAEEAWEWLITPNRTTGGGAPIDELRAGNVEAVVSAAEGALDYT